MKLVPDRHLVVDTNVVKEVYSFHDFMRDADKEETVEDILLSRRSAYRAARSRDTIVFAWFCHLARIEARVLEKETVDLLTHDIPPEDKTKPDTALLQAILYFVGDNVLHGWNIVPFSDDPGSIPNEAADDWLLEKARGEGIPLITNEGNGINGISETKRDGKVNLRGKAKKAGVRVYTPGEYLNVHEFDRGAAAIEFVNCFEREAPRYLATLGEVERTNGGEALGFLAGLYRYVLLGEVDDRYRESPRFSWPNTGKEQLP